MKKTICFLSTLLLCSTAHSDNIYFHLGFTILNCEVADTVDGHIVVNTTDRQQRFPLDVLVSVIKTPFDRNNVTKYYQYEHEVLPQDYPFPKELAAADTLQKPEKFRPTAVHQNI